MIRIKGTTSIVGIFGYPISHTLSPLMHNAAFEQLGLDYCYIPFLVAPEDLGRAVDAIRALRIKGVNITIPYKETVLLWLDEVSEEASFIGAVNTIVNDGGRLKGFNTDGPGFIKALAEAGVYPEGKKVLMIGAGGAARAVGYHLCRAGCSLFLYNRTVSRAETLAADFGRVAPAVSVVDEPTFRDRDFLRSVDIIVNATSLGMSPEDPAPVDPELLNAHHVVCDLIYKETALIAGARRRGAHCLDGSGMLLWQGVLAFELWTGVTPPVDLMRQAIKAQAQQ